MGIRIERVKEIFTCYIRIAAIFIVIFSNAVLYASDVAAATWAKTYGTANREFVGTLGASSIFKVSDGYIIAGTQDSNNVTAILVIKLDFEGNIVWQKKYDSSYADSFGNYEPTSDGGYIVAGISTISTSFGYKVLLLKLDSEGNIQWQKMHDNFMITSIHQLADGGYILGGTSAGGGVYSRESVLRLDLNGNVVWRKYYGWSAGYGVKIKPTADGGFIALGVKPTGVTWIAKLNSTGLIEWQKVYHSDTSENHTFVLELTSDGGVIVGGVEHTHSSPWNDCPFVLKLDSKGNIEWQKVYATFYPPYIRYDVGNSIKGTRDGGYVLGNRSSMLKLDSNGTIQWARAMPYGSIYEYSVAQAEDGSYFAAGYTWAYALGSTDIIVLKLDNNANLFGCSGDEFKDIPVQTADGTLTVSDGHEPVENVSANTLAGNAVAIQTNLVPKTLCFEAKPEIAISPKSIDFGPIEMNNNSTGSVTISNNGSADLIIDSVVISGPNADAFSSVNGCSTIPPNGSCTLKVTFHPTTLSTKSANLNISSNDPDTPTATVALSGTGVDTIPPYTTAGISGIKGSNNWYTSDVSIDLKATDVGSGVKEVYYSIDGTGTVIQGSSASLSLTLEGTHTVTYYAKDNAGNEETPHHELTVMIDKAVPTITATQTPLPNANGWNNTNVTVTFSCNDATSGIANCTGPITVTTEGENQVITGTAVDKAGNTKTTSVTLNIDKTTPSIPSLTASPSVLWPPNHKMVNVTIGGSASDDGGSGIVSTVITVTDEMGIYNMTFSGFGNTIQLEAWRNGTDMDGRLYTITAVTTDKAGNQSTTSTMVLVPHDMR